MNRESAISRKTKETKVSVSLVLDGKGDTNIETGIGFLNHMLKLFAVHGLFDLKVKASGDIDVDQHHVVEDIGICLGQAFKEAIGDRAKINRYGLAYIPMDESLVRTCIDLSGRASLIFRGEIRQKKVGDFNTELIVDFLKAFVDNAQCAIHIDVLYGRSSHHKIEAIFKAFGHAMREAVKINPRIKGILSTK